MTTTRAPKTGGSRRNVLRALGLVAAAVLLAGCQTSSSTPSSAGQPTPPGPSPSATQTEPAGVVGSLVSPNGWPIVVKSDALDELVVGPDGTLYSSAFVPADKAGLARAGWLRLADGSYLVPRSFGPDGSAFGDSQGLLWVFGPDGQARTGWGLDVSASSWAVSPKGTVYLMEWPTEGSTKVTVLDDHGAPVSSWSVPKVLGYSCDYLIQPDGTFWLTYPVTDSSWWGACEIHAFSPTGRELSGQSALRWSGMSTGAGGTIVAWYYVFSNAAQDRPVQTRVAILGTDGKPAKGWPVTLTGAASPPAFGADGTIYFTLLGGDTNTVAAFDAAGHEKTGWPVKLDGIPLTIAPAGTEPLRPQSPIVGDGAVYVAEQGKVEAFDVAGRAASGWPFTLTSPWNDSLCGGGASDPVWNFGPVYSAGTSGSGLLYLALDSGIVAVSPAGSVASGWPYASGADFVCWSQIRPAPDGGLIAAGYYKTAAGSEFHVVRLTPEGVFAK